MTHYSRRRKSKPVKQFAGFTIDNKNNVFSKLKCGKCSIDGKLKIGVSVLDVKSLLNKRMLGVVKDDPSCIKCGTRFPQGFRRVVNGYIYKTKKEVLNKDDGLDSSFN
jgi:hypothetical protein